MKKLSAFGIMLLLVFLGCEQESTVQVLNQENVNGIVDQVQRIRTKDTVDYDLLRIGLSPRAYRLNKEHLDFDQMASEIQTAKALKLPLSVKIDTLTGEVLQVKPATIEAVNEWKNEQLHFQSKSTLKSIELNEVQSVQPSQETQAFIDQVFNAIQTYQCDDDPRTTITSAPYCIPFAFKSDGCYARGHRMRQLLQDWGLTTYKIFVYSDYENGKTLNIPGCDFGWTYHTAPIVLRNGTWWVIDPSLSDKPLRTWEWKAIMGSNNIVNTDYRPAQDFAPDSFDSHPGYITDDDYFITHLTLDRYQNKFGCESTN